MISPSTLMMPVLDVMQYNVQVITVSLYSVISHVSHTPDIAVSLKSPTTTLSVVYNLLYAPMSSIHTLPPVVIVSFQPG
jgi:hypothetical protein